MQRRGFLAGILAAGMAPAIVHNPMKIFVPRQGIQVWGPKVSFIGDSILYYTDVVNPSAEGRRRMAQYIAEQFRLMPQPNSSILMHRA